MSLLLTCNTTTTTTITSQTGGSAGRAATPAVPSVTLRCVSGAPVVRGNHALDGVQRHKMPAGRGGGTVCGRSSRHAGRRDRDAAVCGGQVAGPGGVQLFHQGGCGGHGRQQLTDTPHSRHRRPTGVLVETVLPARHVSIQSVGRVSFICVVLMLLGRQPFGGRGGRSINIKGIMTKVSAPSLTCLKNHTETSRIFTGPALRARSIMVCSSVCLSARELISVTKCPIFINCLSMLPMATA